MERVRSGESEVVREVECDGVGAMVRCGVLTG